MTAIIAIKDGKQVIIGADGKRSTDVNAWSIKDESSYKVQFVNGSPNCLIACAGPVTNNNVIMNIKNLLDGKKDVSFKYMVNKVLPKIYNKLDEAHLIKKDKRYNSIESSIIIATKNHLYKISGAGTISERTQVATIGSGEEMLLCKYQAIKDSKLSTQDKVIECLKHAVKYGQAIDYPLVIKSTNPDHKPIVIEK